MHNLLCMNHHQQPCVAAAKQCGTDILHANELSTVQCLELAQCHSATCFIPVLTCVGLQRNVQDLITQDSNLDSDVGLNLIQMLGGSNDVYGAKRRRNSASSASDDSFIGSR